jgi:ketosteroid isomerase-like protein
MTTQENKDLIQRIFAGFASRNGSLFLDSIADDAAWENIGRGSWSGTFRGKESIVRDLLGPLRGRLAERSRTLAHRFIAEGEYVVVEARGDNVTKQGVRYDNEYCFVFHLKDGKIRHIKEYADTALIAEVLGELAPAAS